MFKRDFVKKVFERDLCVYRKAALKSFNRMEVVGFRLFGEGAGI